MGLLLTVPDDADENLTAMVSFTSQSLGGNFPGGFFCPTQPASLLVEERDIETDRGRPLTQRHCRQHRRACSSQHT